MAEIQPLFSLQKTQSGGRIRVQVIRKWSKKFTHYAPEKHLIIADEAGDRMYCTIRAHFLFNFVNTLVEGRWYEISAFEVNTRAEDIKFSRSPYHIYLNNYTSVEPAPEFNAVCKMYSPMDFTPIKDGSLYQSYNIVDLLGVIVEVHEMEVYPEYDRPVDEIPPLKCIRIIVQDFEGERIQCVAKNGLADKFLKEWVTTLSGWPHIIVLRFWEIKELAGY